jgi:hypothetical protein
MFQVLGLTRLLQDGFGRLNKTGQCSHVRLNQEEEGQECEQQEDGQEHDKQARSESD